MRHSDVDGWFYARGMRLMKRTAPTSQSCLPVQYNINMYIFCVGEPILYGIARRMNGGDTETNKKVRPAKHANK